MFKIIYIVFCLVLFAKCDDPVEDCSDSFACVEKEMIRSVDDLDDVGPIGDYLILKRTKPDSGARDPDEGLVKRAVRYLEEHELRLRIPSIQARSLDIEARTKRLRKIILPILLLLKLKAAIILPIILSAISLVAFKGLGAGLIALAIAGATGFKSLLDSHSGHSKISYEIVPPVAPQWSRSSIDHGGYGESALVAGYHTMV